ncbi:golgin subfamily A member 4-like [Hordeum vulgare]|nr:golgin subfamily A member 4-like [Hordeum vulgare]
MADGGDGEGAGESCWPTPATADSGHGGGVGEGASESCWPTPATADSGHGGGGGVLLSDVRREIYDRLRAVGNQEALADPFFNRVLEDNYQRLPPSELLSAFINYFLHCKVGVPKQLFVNTDPLSIPAAVMRAGLSLPLGKKINGLRQGFSVELENRSVGSSESITRMQMELLGLTGVEQKLRKEIQSCNLEVESLQQENIGILNRLQSSGNGLSLSSHRLVLELHTRVDNLQMQGLSLLEDTSCLCGKLLGVMKSKSETIGSVDALADIEYTLKYQNLRQGMDYLALSPRKVKSVLVEKHNKEDNIVGVSVGHDTLYIIVVLE